MSTEISKMLWVPSVDSNSRAQMVKSIQGIAFFSTEGGQLEPRPAPIPRPTLLVRSDPANDVETFVRKLRCKWPHVCNSIFAHNDGFDIRWFFDEHDFVVQGGQFCFNVVCRLMQENQARVEEMARNWSNTHRHSYQSFREISELGVTHAFHEIDISAHGHVLLEEVLRLIAVAWESARKNELTVLNNDTDIGMQAPGNYQSAFTGNMIRPCFVQDPPPHRRTPSGNFVNAQYTQYRQDPQATTGWNNLRRSNKGTGRAVSNESKPPRSFNRSGEFELANQHEPRYFYTNITQQADMTGLQFHNTYVRPHSGHFGFGARPGLVPPPLPLDLVHQSKTGDSPHRSTIGQGREDFYNQRGNFQNYTSQRTFDHGRRSSRELLEDTNQPSHQKQKTSSNRKRKNSASHGGKGGGAASARRPSVSQVDGSDLEQGINHSTRFDKSPQKTRGSSDNVRAYENVRAGTELITHGSFPARTTECSPVASYRAMSNATTARDLTDAEPLSNQNHVEMRPNPIAASTTDTHSLHSINAKSRLSTAASEAHAQSTTPAPGLMSNESDMQIRPSFIGQGVDNVFSLWVGKIAMDTTESQMREAFEHVATISSITPPKLSPNGHGPYMFVKFHSTDDVRKVLNAWPIRFHGAILSIEVPRYLHTHDQHGHPLPRPCDFGYKNYNGSGFNGVGGSPYYQRFQDHHRTALKTVYSRQDARSDFVPSDPSDNLGNLGEEHMLPLKERVQEYVGFPMGVDTSEIQVSSGEQIQIQSIRPPSPTSGTQNKSGPATAEPQSVTEERKAIEKVLPKAQFLTVTDPHQRGTPSEASVADDLVEEVAAASNNVLFRQIPGLYVTRKHSDQDGHLPLTPEREAVVQFGHFAESETAGSLTAPSKQACSPISKNDDLDEVSGAISTANESSPAQTRQTLPNVQAETQFTTIAISQSSVNSTLEKRSFSATMRESLAPNVLHMKHPSQSNPFAKASAVISSTPHSHSKPNRSKNTRKRQDLVAGIRGKEQGGLNLASIVTKVTDMERDHTKEDLPAQTPKLMIDPSSSSPHGPQMTSQDQENQVLSLAAEVRSAPASGASGFVSTMDQSCKQSSAQTSATSTPLVQSDSMSWDTFSAFMDFKDWRGDYQAVLKILAGIPQPNETNVINAMAGAEDLALKFDQAQTKLMANAQRLSGSNKSARKKLSSRTKQLKDYYEDLILELHLLHETVKNILTHQQMKAKSRPEIKPAYPTFHPESAVFKQVDWSREGSKVDKANNSPQVPVEQTQWRMLTTEEDESKGTEDVKVSDVQKLLENVRSGKVVDEPTDGRKLTLGNVHVDGETRMLILYPADDNSVDGHIDTQSRDGDASRTPSTVSSVLGFDYGDSEPDTSKSTVARPLNFEPVASCTDGDSNSHAQGLGISNVSNPNSALETHSNGSRLSPVPPFAQVSSPSAIRAKSLTNNLGTCRSTLPPLSRSTSRPLESPQPQATPRSYAHAAAASTAAVAGVMPQVVPSKPIASPVQLMAFSHPQAAVQASATLANAGRSRTDRNLNGRTTGLPLARSRGSSSVRSGGGGTGAAEGEGTVDDDWKTGPEGPWGSKGFPAKKGG